MRCWLIKSEPEVYSWEQFEADGKTVWDGVRNYHARNNLRDMKKGDLCFWYHSNEGREIVGIAKVIKESYIEPGQDNPNWLAVDVKPFQKLKKSVSLETIKIDSILSQMQFVRLWRLSVSEVNASEMNRILELSSTKLKVK